MQIINFVYFLAFLYAATEVTDAKIMGVVGEKIYECDDIPKSNRIEAVDYSNFKVYQENDTHSYFNGSLKFLEGFFRLPGRVYTEQYVRGKWVIQLFDRHYMDMCLSFHNPAEPFYNQTRSFPKCPIVAGTEWKFDMVHLIGSDNLLENFPTNLIGLWRVTLMFDFNVLGKSMKACKRIHCDIYEV